MNPMRGRKRKQGRRYPGGKLIQERIGPTPETEAKKTDDPLWLIISGHDSKIQDAAEEIKRVWEVICRDAMTSLMAWERRDRGKKAEMPDEIARIYSEFWKPWAADMGRDITGEVLTVLVDRVEVPNPKTVEYALEKYARRRWLRLTR